MANKKTNKQRAEVFVVVIKLPLKNPFRACERSYV